jgi:PPOX class probable F420-dependent enzyme
MRDWSEVASHFSTTAVAHLATLQQDGSPRVVPVWIDVHGDTDLVFFAETSSLNARNVSRDPRVAISITRPDQSLDMAAIRGEVIERLDGEAAMAVVDRISQKYTGGQYDIRAGMAAFVVRPRTWTANDYSAG